MKTNTQALLSKFLGPATIAASLVLLPSFANAQTAAAETLYAQHQGGKSVEKDGHSGTSGHDSTSHSDSTHGSDKVLRGKGARPSTQGKGVPDSDSDRKPWAGGGGKPGTGKPTTAGSKKGDLFGDMVIILRDANGVPILTPEGYVQPLDANGNPIPLNAEGDPVDPTLVVEVELGRLNVGRSPSKVLSKSLSSAVTTLNDATAISFDSAGRFVVTIDGVQKTIDSPLENLALYQVILNTGTIPNLDTSALNLLSTVAPNLIDGVRTTQDLASAAVFLAGSADKTGTIKVDTVVYMNSILRVDGTIVQNGTEYIDYSTYSYDRASTYTGTVTYLKAVGDGTYVTVTEPIMTAVFSGVTYSSTSGVTGYAQAVDDALQVIEFVHDHQIPTS